MSAEAVADLGLMAAAFFGIPWIYARSFAVRLAKTAALGALLAGGVLLGVPWWLAWTAAALMLGLSGLAWFRAVRR